MNAGVAFAVAAGNDDDDADNYSPGGFDNVLSVSALADFDGIPGGLGSATCRADQDDTLADFSNWGPEVDVAAPGVCILSTYPIEQGSYGTISGTSMASPHAAGALALLASANNPNSATDVYDLYNAVKAAGNLNWTDDSGDGIPEPLLDVSNPGIFNPVLVPGTGGLPPAAPMSLVATATSSSQVNLAWVDSDATETGFKIERCTGAGCSDFAQIATVGANVTTYANTGLAASTSYSYRVRAYNTAGDSNYSNTATSVTQAAPALPAAPTDLVATAVSRSQINITWAAISDNETGFKIERCKGSTCTNFSQITTVGANVASYSNTGLAKNTTYRYRVRAYNASGNSAVLEHRRGHHAEILRGTPARTVPSPLAGLGGHPPPRPAQPPATSAHTGGARAEARHHRGRSPGWAAMKRDARLQGLTSDHHHARRGTRAPLRPRVGF